MLNALTIDLEDWYHPELVRPRLSSPGLAAAAGCECGAQPHGDSDTSRFAAQIEASTQVLLGLLREKQVKATFFVVGEIAQRHPRLIEVIAADGHELACHGLTHRPLWQMTPDEFRSELRQCAAAISAAAPGAEVLGFRAPTFSLDNRTRWALTILADLGYYYDSSVFPVRMPVYGVSRCPLEPYRPSFDDLTLVDKEGALVEFPMSVWSWAGLRVPVCGGFYLRAWPFRLILWALRQINRRRPFVIYAHPWEVLADTPRVSLPLSARFVTYYNLRGMRPRLTALLDAFPFAPMRSVLEEMGELRK